MSTWVHAWFTLHEDLDLNQQKCSKSIVTKTNTNYWACHAGYCTCIWDSSNLCSCLQPWCRYLHLPKPSEQPAQACFHPQQWSWLCGSLPGCQCQCLGTCTSPHSLHKQCRALNEGGLEMIWHLGLYLLYNQYLKCYVQARLSFLVNQSQMIDTVDARFIRISKKYFAMFALISMCMSWLVYLAVITLSLMFLIEGTKILSK